MSEVEFNKFERGYKDEGFLIGKLEGALKPISLEGRELFTTKISVPRMSGNVDVIPLLISGRLYSKASACSKEEDVHIEGVFRSFAEHDRSRPIQYFFEVKTLHPRVKNFARNNSIHLCGNVCGQPRGVKIGPTQLTYFNLAVNTHNSKNIFSCYVRPVYQEAVESLQISDYVDLYGRMQSISNDPTRPPLYPISVSKFDVIGYRGTRINYTPPFVPIKYREQ